MSVILTGINADIKCIDCPMRDLDDNCISQEHSGDTWEEMKADCPLKSVDGLIKEINEYLYENDFGSEYRNDVAKIIKEYCGMEEKWLTREELNRKAVEKLKTAIEAYEQKPCEDCISREDALMCLAGNNIADKECPPDEIISKHIKRIKALPSVQPARRKGKWILAENGWNTVCDFCGKGKWKGYIPTPEEAAKWMPICPRCGADMKESEEQP